MRAGPGGWSWTRAALLAVPLLATTLLLAGCGDGVDPITETVGEATTAPGATTAPERGGPPSRRPAVGDGRGGVALREIGSFDSPVQVAQPPKGDDHLYVVERGGTVQRVSPDGDRETFLDLSSMVLSGGEQGLLSIAFSPNYADSGRFYVNYTDRNGDTRVVEYEARDGRAEASSARGLLRIDQPYANHNGGLVAFGPEGLLYVGMGDGGGADDPSRNGLDPTTLLGKLLRIDPRPDGGLPYSIPADNPYADDGDDATRAEIYSIGLRNPWRFSFDRPSGLLTIGDVGQDSQEEIDAIDLRRANGANFGWSAFEGKARFNQDQPAAGTVEPVLTQLHEQGFCSITGGLIVRDESLPSLYGRYLYGDLCRPELRSFIPRGGRDGEGDRPLGIEVPGLVSFGSDADDHVYVVSIEGPVYELIAG